MLKDILLQDTSDILLDYEDIDISILNESEDNISC